MFNKQNKTENFEKAETIIGQAIKVKGNFHGQGNIIIEGTIEGSLKTSGNVFISNKAKILANVEAKSMKVGGEINGNVKIKDYLEVISTAKIFGDIECSILSVESGAIINGKCIMTGQGEKHITQDHKAHNMEHVTK